MSLLSPTDPVLATWQESEWHTVKVQITPKVVREFKCPKNKPPRYIVHRVLTAGDGTHFCIPCAPYGPCVRLTEDITDHLGLPIAINTLRRLINGGFVNGYKITPKTILIDLSSLWEHLNNCRIDPEAPSFWTRDRHEKWLASRDDWRTSLYDKIEGEEADDDEEEEDADNDATTTPLNGRP